MCARIDVQPDLRRRIGMYERGLPRRVVRFDLRARMYGGLADEQPSRDHTRRHGFSSGSVDPTAKWRGRGRLRLHDVRAGDMHTLASV